MLKKFLLGILAMLVAGDAVLLHGRYRERMGLKAEVVEYTVRSQDWSTPLVDNQD